MSELSANQKVVNYILDLLKNEFYRDRYNKLPTEAELSQKLNVSRNSVREAMKTLQNIGIIYSVRGSGYRVESDLEGALIKITQVLFDIMPNSYNYNDISDIREVLEIKILLLLQSQEVNSEDIMCLEKYVSNMKNGIDPEENDQQFHLKLASMTNNSLMRFISNALLSRVSRNYILIPWNLISDEDKQKLIISHEEIIKEISQNTPNIINDNSITAHYRLADEIINKQNKLYDDASLANMTINELIKADIPIERVNIIFKEMKNSSNEKKL